jgi:acylphosphatase
MASGEKRLHVRVYGRVQGVSFRYYTVLRAKELELVGWVSNVDDGSVEVTAEGLHDQLERLLVFLRSGPSGARVTNIDANWLDATHEYSDFNVR